MAGRNRMASRGPTLPAHEESQIWNEALNSLKQLPDVHAKATKIVAEANKNQRLLLTLANGEGMKPPKIVLICRSECGIIGEDGECVSRRSENCRTTSEVDPPRH
jgi:hypothetical protein